MPTDRETEEIRGFVVSHPFAVMALFLIRMGPNIFPSHHDLLQYVGELATMELELMAVLREVPGQACFCHYSLASCICAVKVFSVEEVFGVKLFSCVGSCT